MQHKTTLSAPYCLPNKWVQWVVIILVHGIQHLCFIRTYICACRNGRAVRSVDLQSAGCQVQFPSINQSYSFHLIWSRFHGCSWLNTTPPPADVPILADRWVHFPLLRYDTNLRSCHQSWSLVAGGILKFSGIVMTLCNVLYVAWSGVIWVWCKQCGWCIN